MGDSTEVGRLRLWLTSPQVLMLICQAVLIGIAWGTLKADMADMRRDLDEVRQVVGNGHPGRFMRIEEAKLLIRGSEERDAAIIARLDRIEAKLDRAAR